MVPFIGGGGGAYWKVLAASVGSAPKIQRLEAQVGTICAPKPTPMVVPTMNLLRLCAMSSRLMIWYVK